LDVNDPVSQAASEPSSPSAASVTSTSLEEVERAHIRRVLQEVGWRIEGDRGAARVLDLKPSTLRARMRKLGIRKPA